MTGDCRPDAYLKVFGDKDAEVAAGPEVAKVFKAADEARQMAKSNVQDWNQATNMVITGQAGGQIMGDWAQGEFQVAGQGRRQGLHLPAGLGVNEVIATGGDAFYFPVLTGRGKEPRRKSSPR
jgi:glucose/mannose transport system substrate-binding protein